MGKHSEAFLNLVNESKKNIKECSTDDVRSWQNNNEDFALVDTREDREWQKDFITGAIHVGKGVIERDVEKLVPDKTKKTVLYCGGGFRSALAAEALQKMGYENVISMDGGIREWKEKEYPISSEAH